MTKQNFEVGEFVTALPNNYYGYTTDGWTGKVHRRQSDNPEIIYVEGYDSRGERSLDAFDVRKKYFVPYSENMAAEDIFKQFRINGGD